MNGAAARTVALRAAPNLRAFLMAVLLAEEAD
jgi:hypothetical protein